MSADFADSRRVFVCRFFSDTRQGTHLPRLFGAQFATVPAEASIANEENTIVAVEQVNGGVSQVRDSRHLRGDIFIAAVVLLVYDIGSALSMRGKEFRNLVRPALLRLTDYRRHRYPPR